MTYIEFVGSLLADVPGYLTDNSGIIEMRRALPATWRQQASKMVMSR